MTESHAMRRLSIYGVAVPASLNLVLCGILMLVPRTPVIVFQIGWSVFTLVACGSFVIVLIRGDRRSRIIAAAGMAILFLFVGFIVLVVLAVRAAFST